MRGRVFGVAEGIVGETIGLIAAFRLAEFLTGRDTGSDFMWIAFAVAGIPLLIGTGVPVYRHGRTGAAGVATGWALAFASLSFVALTSRDSYLAEGTAFTLIILVVLILPAELLGLGIGLWLRRRAAPRQTHSIT
jgi:threonine/homoserine efflux transporter RhtA